ncbi:LEA14-like dessication related protein [Catalinimonas alkaloidigena]|uniref:LEA type 2 family protein n=1 Tax=Catalinimonas alkaloidigena TaxID=1075417 RepID=UPI0024052A12|nr:LEA type 2 family protein [Catalinimonas alkaloidigena]MDF9800062.1 LEA14-like dessication related protein [Catalinimonas alkaloidigena]
MNQLWKQYSNKVTLWMMVLVIGTAACSTPEAPDFNGVKNFKIDVQGLSKAQINGDAVFFNPNKQKIKIRQVDVSVFVEGEKVKDISQEFDITAMPNSEFVVPIDVTLSLGDLNMNLLNTALSMLNGATKKVRYEGRARVTVNGLPFRVPFEHEDDVKIDL